MALCKANTQVHNVFHLFCSGVGQFNIGIVSTLCKLTYRVIVISIKIQIVALLFLGTRKRILKFVWKYKGPKVSETRGRLKKKIKVIGLALQISKITTKTQ